MGGEEWAMSTGRRAGGRASPRDTACRAGNRRDGGHTSCSNTLARSARCGTAREARPPSPLPGRIYIHPSENPPRPPPRLSVLGLDGGKGEGGVQCEIQLFFRQIAPARGERGGVIQEGKRDEAGAPSKRRAKTDLILHESGSFSFRGSTGRLNEIARADGQEARSVPPGKTPPLTPLE